MHPQLLTADEFTCKSLAVRNLRAKVGYFQQNKEFLPGGRGRGYRELVAVSNKKGHDLQTWPVARVMPTSQLLRCAPCYCTTM